MAVATQVLVHLVKEDPERAARLIAEEMPWLIWLPEDERATCVQELVANLAAGADTGTLEPFAWAVRERRGTAEVWADPELAGLFRTGFRGEGTRVPPRGSWCGNGLRVRDPPTPRRCRAIP